MDIQKAYSTIVTHLLHQNRQAAVKASYPGGTPNCRYRAPGGLKCAAGVLISDDKYQEGMEGSSVHWDPVSNQPDRTARAAGCETEIDVYFLRDAQSVHDCHPPDEWPIRLAALGRRYRVTYDPF